MSEESSFGTISLTPPGATILAVGEMNDAPEPTTTWLDDDVLIELAAELHRLAAGLKRDLQRNAVLPGLSDLTAMRPLQAMLIEALSARVGRSQATREVPEHEAPIDYEMPGYL